MMEIAEVVKVRIDSLQHTRQLVTVLAGGLTGIYTVIGVFSANEGLFFGISEQGTTSWYDPAWNSLALGLFLTLIFTNLFFILSVFLLTDSIHHYSKILEYRQKDLFTDAESKANLSHQRALTSDDLSYFCLRIGTFLFTFNLLLALPTAFVLLGWSMQPYVAYIGLFVCGVVAFGLVLFCYRVSHYKVPERSFDKSVVRFLDFRRWRDSVKGSVGARGDQDAE